MAYSLLADVQANWKMKGAIRCPTSLDDEVFPCHVRGCKTLRSVRQGGTTFTICDEHWEAKYGRLAKVKGRCA